MTRFPVAALDSTKSRYLLVGAWNTLFGVALFALTFSWLGERVPYPWILLACQVIAVLQAHWSQRTFVWRSLGSFWPELSRFSIVYVASYFANLGALALCVEWIGWPVLPSQVGITGALVVATYAVNRRWTFNRHQPQG